MERNANAKDLADKLDHTKSLRMPALLKGLEGIMISENTC